MRERRIPRSGDAQGEECRMPFIGPLKGACPGLCPQKARRHSFLEDQAIDKMTFFLTSKIHSTYVKIIHMISQKSQSSHPHWGGGLIGN